MYKININNLKKITTRVENLKKKIKYCLTVENSIKETMLKDVIIELFLHLFQSISRKIGYVCDKSHA